MNKFFISSVLLLLVPTGLNLAFATTWDVTIPTGAADPTNAEQRFFYSPWELTVETYDKVQWGNGDTAAHTITSGNPTDGPDGTFDSGLIGPGKLFTYKFMKSGTFDYYCTVYPWMTGTVNVKAVEEFKVLHNVGSDAGDGQTTFDMEYLLDKVLASAAVDENEKAVTFTMAGVGSDDDVFVVKLPKDLVSGPLLVWVDNQQITDFEQVEEGGINTLTIPLTAKSEIVTIIGTAVVPEFGPIAVLILAVAIIATIAVSAKITIPKL
ncbi:MAG: PEFG-CTERM sorting domain-containing protein [Nitrosopumilaceae archaeon]